jgi:DNA-binding response OmpR family regulator
VVILDVNLSEMDGRMVCERIKTRAETRNTRILAMSGFISDDEVKELTDYGFDDFIRKPFTMEDLGNRVAALFDLSNTRVNHPRRTHL